MNVMSKLTIFFEDPFWIGIYQRTSNNKTKVSKTVFGSEPKDYEVYEYYLINFNKLKFSPPVNDLLKVDKIKNPKRKRREIKRQLQNKVLGTKAQQALKLQQEQFVLEHKKNTKENKEKMQEYKFNLKQQKKLQKHKGR